MICIYSADCTDLFQFTPLREGRRDGDVERRGAVPHFNSRPSARGDCPRRTAPSPRRYFNSRPSARGDNVAAFSVVKLFYFNSRPSARGD